MKDLLSKEYYCYKMYTLLMASSAYPVSIDNRSYMVYSCIYTLLHMGDMVKKMLSKLGGSE